MTQTSQRQVVEHQHDLSSYFEILADGWPGFKPGTLKLCGLAPIQLVPGAKRGKERKRKGGTSLFLKSFLKCCTFI